MKNGPATRKKEKIERKKSKEKGKVKRKEERRWKGRRGAK